MFQILIVDDEEHAADSLSISLDWAKYGVQKVFTAYSGYEAMEVLRSETIHLLITDIRMPEMSGLQLIEEASKVSAATKVIVISGYDEFTYAQRAVQYGALDYMLKPVKDDELEQLVERVMATIRQEWETVSVYQNAVLTLKSNLSLLQSSLFQELINGKSYRLDQLNERLSRYELHFQTGDPIALVTMRFEWEESKYDPQSRELIEFAVRNIAEELTSTHFHLWICKDPNDFILLLLRPGNSEEEDQQQEWSHLLERKIYELKRVVQELLNLSSSIAISPFGTFADDLPVLYEDSLSAFRRRIGKERGLIIQSKEEGGLGEAIHINYLNEQPSLLQLLETGSWDKATEKLQDIFRKFNSGTFSSQEYVLELYFYISHAFSHIAHKNSVLLGDIVGDALLKPPTTTLDFSLKQLEVWSFSLLNKYIGYAMTEWQDNRRTIVDQIRQFIDKHLSDAITVEWVAENLYFNPDYLNKIYKSETGETITEYMYKQRMQRAASLLIETDDWVYDIGERVGYVNANYFIKMFKRHYDLTPQAFRDKYREV
ncbi:response regulator transcription factor [Paenibacillus chungangensis]|uniref:Response regulator n=1 Tax=Paenibacillus chungangensis TaxID=696535 RepID=A0ABW3HW29_9BACL